MTVQQAFHQSFGQLPKFVVRAPESTLALLGKVPTTNVRILVTLGAVMLTTLRYVTSDVWVPSLEWLGFLVAMSGVDAVQFYSKRVTHTPGSPTTPQVPQ